MIIKFVHLIFYQNKTTYGSLVKKSSLYHWFINISISSCLVFPIYLLGGHYFVPHVGRLDVCVRASEFCLDYFYCYTFVWRGYELVRLVSDARMGEARRLFCKVKRNSSFEIQGGTGVPRYIL